MRVAWAEVQPTGGAGKFRPLSRYLNSARSKSKRGKPCRTRKILGFYQGPCPQLLRCVCVLDRHFLDDDHFVLPLPCLEETRHSSTASDALILIKVLQWLLHLRVPPYW
jgi:hypothetical protein